MCRSLLRPHLLDLERAIAPARTIMTWTSMNIDTFISSLHTVLARFEYLVSQINDIIHNRVAKNLNLVSTMVLLTIPPGRTFTLRDFVALQRAHLESCTDVLLAKNEEIERAVDDLVDAVLLYPLDASIAKTSAFDVNLVKLHYNHLMYHALLGATKRSLNDLKRRVSETGSITITDGSAVDATPAVAAPPAAGGAAAAAAAADKDKAAKAKTAAAEDDGSTGPVIVSSALFEVDLSLQVPKVTLSPSLDEVQDAINAVARDVLQCTRKLIDWGIDPTSSSGKRPRRSFYERLASDKNLAVVLLLLTGAVEETKLRALSHLSKYDSYAWLWQKDPESVYKEFLAQQSPILEDFVAELHKFVAVEAEIAEFPSAEQMGCLHLKTDGLKAAFKHETERWKFQYSEKLHQEAKADMDAVSCSRRAMPAAGQGGAQRRDQRAIEEAGRRVLTVLCHCLCRAAAVLFTVPQITEQMHDLKSKLERDVKDFASLKFVMDAQAEIRDVQSWIDMKFELIIERYNTLEKYLPFGVMSKDEMDTKSVLRTQWSQILSMSSQVMSNVNGLQGGFKQDLMDNVRHTHARTHRAHQTRASRSGSASPRFASLRFAWTCCTDPTHRDRIADHCAVVVCICWCVRLCRCRGKTGQDLQSGREALPRRLRPQRSHGPLRRPQRPRRQVHPAARGHDATQQVQARVRDAQPQVRALQWRREALWTAGAEVPRSRQDVSCSAMRRGRCGAAPCDAAGGTRRLVRLQTHVCISLFVSPRVLPPLPVPCVSLSRHQSQGASSVGPAVHAVPAGDQHGGRVQGDPVERGDGEHPADERDRRGVQPAMQTPAPRTQVLGGVPRAQPDHRGFHRDRTCTTHALPP